MKTIDNAYKNEIQSFAFGFLTDIGLASYFSENYIIVPGLCISESRVFYIKKQ